MSAGITHVRDCGSDPHEVLRWRDEIRRGVRRGPRIIAAGWIIDGPKNARFRLTVRSAAEAEAALDSLQRLSVDFVKTHSGLSREAYFAVLRAGRARGLKVVSHLPRTVPAWEAADSGVSDIEHAAESMMASLLYAGLVDHPARAEAREGRRRLLPFLVELTGRLHRAGVPILAGSDFADAGTPLAPGASLHDELRWLARAGLSPEEVRRAASANVEKRWLEGASPPRARPAE